MADLSKLPTLYISWLISPEQGLSDIAGGSSFSPEDARKFLRENKEAIEIVVEISSNGGYKTECQEMYNILKNSGKRITTVGYKVNSIATVIVLAGDERLVVDPVEFVI